MAEAFRSSPQRSKTIQRTGVRPMDNSIKYWSSHDGLLLIEGWARDGLTNEQIAHNMGIATQTLYRWKKKNSGINDALKRSKEVVDREVENALYKKALSGDTTAMIFWLKNRKYMEWRDRKDTQLSGNVQTVPSTLVFEFGDGDGK